nr:unnamed protein product [Digitaria exilis]
MPCHRGVLEQVEAWSERFAVIHEDDTLPGEEAGNRVADLVACQPGDNGVAEDGEAVVTVQGMVRHPP